MIMCGISAKREMSDEIKSVLEICKGIMVDSAATLTPDKVKEIFHLMI